MSVPIHPVHLSLLEDHDEISAWLDQLRPDHPLVPRLKVRIRRIERHLLEWEVRERIHAEHMQKKDHRAREAYWEAVDRRESRGADKAHKIKKAMRTKAKRGVVGAAKMVLRPVIQVVAAVLTCVSAQNTYSDLLTSRTGRYLEDKRQDFLVWFDADVEARQYRYIRRAEVARYREQLEQDIHVYQPGAYWGSSRHWDLAEA
jgi:hypothetical protein